MAYESNVKFTAQDFINLKARVKAEMTRRKGTGSLTSYAGTSYDYTTAPVAGGNILEEYIDKLITPLSKISFSDIADQSKGDTVKAMNTLDAKLSTYESAGVSGSGHYCNSSCSGMCSTGCYSGCTGCSGSCSGCTSCSSCTGCTGCSGYCSGCTGCSGTCRGCTSCSGCSGGCTSCTGCGMYCDFACTTTCAGTCRGSCYDMGA